MVNVLQGKVAGVNITSSGGATGEGASIVIRGGTSLDGDNQPLFVIDGMIMDNSSFQESTAPGGGSAFNGLLGAALALATLASGCKKDLDTYFTEVGGQIPTLRSVLGTATFGSGTGTNIKFATGEVIPIEIQFAQQTSPRKQTVILQKNRVQPRLHRRANHRLRARLFQA